MKFTELDLTTEILQGIQKAGYADCTPIQEKVIPHILQGKDVSGLAQTGTGKTAAFLIPLMDRYIRGQKGETSERAVKNWGKNSYNLILVPTRELATQVEESVKLLGGEAGFRSAIIIGGEAYENQLKALRDNVQFVVGTPGRLLDLYKSHQLDLRGVNAIVFDEADRMFDMGFKDDMKFILRRVPRERQFLLFSATLNFDVLNTSYQFGAEPIEFNVSRDQATAEGVEHELLHIGAGEKPKFLLSVLKKTQPNQCIVFSNFKQNVARIALFLKRNGIEAIGMSSLLSQAQRNKVMEQFKTGDKKVLVATDVAARGLDIKGVDLVINFELPDDPEGYVHRIGRTGRAGATGRAIGLCSDMDVEALSRIESYLKEKVKIGWMEEKDLITEFQPFPSESEAFRASGGTGPSRGGPRPSRGPGGGGERGPRPQRPPRGPRPPAKPHARSGDRPAEPRPAGTPPAEGDVTLPSALTGQHRDRQSGRHHSQDRVAAAAKLHGEGKRHGRTGHGERHAQGHGNRHGQGHGKKPAHKHVVQHSHRRPLKKNEGIGQKIKKIFGRLFGSSK